MPKVTKVSQMCTATGNLFVISQSRWGTKNIQYIPVMESQQDETWTESSSLDMAVLVYTMKLHS